MPDQPTGPATPKKEADETTPLSPLRTLSGSLIAGTLGVLMYRLTSAIALSFATHPYHGHSQISLSLSSATRTLVVGLSSLATGIFALAALGLVGLSLQLLIRQRAVNPKL
jgi:hypothetical protein